MRDMEGLVNTVLEHRFQTGGAAKLSFHIFSPSVQLGHKCHLCTQVLSFEPGLEGTRSISKAQRRVSISLEVTGCKKVQRKHG